MPNREQTQNPDRSQGVRKPGTFSPNDDETAQNEDNQRQAQEQEEGVRDDTALPGSLDVETDDADEDLDTDDDDDDDKAGGAR